MEVYTLFFDGSCGPKNPGGTAAYGFKLCRAGEEIEIGHDIIGTGAGMTNNLAEFTGLALGLKSFIVHHLPLALLKGKAILNVRGDSQLVINIMSKRWKASKDKLYYPAYLPADSRVRQLRQDGVTVNFDWIPREANEDCDRLSKAHLTATLT